MVKERKLLSFAPQKRFVDMTSRFFNAIVQVVLPGHAHVFIEVLRGFVDPEERDVIFLLMKSFVQNEGRALPLLQRRIRVQTVGIRSVRLRLLQD